MLLTATITDMLQQALIDAPLWVTFVAPAHYQLSHSALRMPYLEAQMKIGATRTY